ncbi:helix-turn-helix domain-containing protein [Paenibacillus lautus]|uniref:TrmB family transcriptional regulator n=1 Tax=Paenibacillus lautus TaxID=1401 RepID=A0A385TZ09_PAELA|nr:TrmB family transcriptional regulator [Paenibacillus lautus]AYB46545.1 TrmB family transcriptional regulator [Paenibacillus lautus]
MEQLLHHLRNLGFTEIESKIMVDLAEHGPAGGYEVAKRLGASRSNVYAAMQRLERQGALERMDGEPVRYRSLKPEELTRMISGRVEASLAFVEKSLPRSSGTAAPFLSMEGDQAVLDVLVRELKRAKREIVVDVWREEASLLREPLAEAEARGVKVLWACDGPDQGLSRTLAWPGWSDLADRRAGGRKFSFVIDRQWCILGMRGGDYDTGAVITEHPVMAELLLHHFTQEMVLFQLEQDMGEQLEERYGEHFGLIQSEYLNAEPEAEAQEDQEDQAASPITRPLSEDEGDPGEEVNGNSNRNTA